MIVCNECKHINRIGFLYCEECGSNLLSLRIVSKNSEITDPTATNTVPALKPTRKTSEPLGHRTFGTAQLTDKSGILFRFPDTRRPMEFKPGKRMVLGRSDAGSLEKPDLDLNPWGATEKGVSRQHAVLELKEDTLLLSDAGSANGTYINGQRLTPGQPRILRDGDEVRWGKLVAHVQFK